MPVPVLRWANSAAEKGTNQPLDWIRLTRPQRDFVAWDTRLGLWIDGNRLGKSWALAYDGVQTARNSHPFLRLPPGPKRCLIASYSWDQMEPLQEKIWKMLPKDEIDPRNGFDEGRGITGKPPRIRFVSGPGRGSVITFATFKAGSQRIAGGAYHWIGSDEPPTEGMYGELKPRTLTTRGRYKMTFTPTPESPPLGWCRELVEKGVISKKNVGLEEAHTWPIWPARAPRPLLTQDQIDEEASTWLSHELEMRLRGAWEPISLDRWVLNFTEENVASFSLRDLPAGAFVAVGVDHGLQPGKQAAVLVVIWDRDGPRPRVWFVDETYSEGFTSPEQDARNILEMLRRNGLSYGDVDDWIGDYPTGEHKRLVQKTNAELRRELALALGVKTEDTSWIHTPKKWDGSVRHGLRKMNGLFGARDQDGKPLALVNARMKRLRKFLENFKGDSRHPEKDVGDAARYPVERNVKANTFGGGTGIYLG